MSRWVRAWSAPAASAVLALLTFAPFNLWPLGLVALWPLFLRLREPGAWEGWKLGYRFGLLFAAGQMFWVVIFVGKWTGSLGLALVPWLLSTALFALYYGLAGLAIARVFGAGKPWLAPLIWAGTEVLRAYVPVLAFPWGLLAIPLWHALPIANAAPFVSLFGLSAWLTLPAVLITQPRESRGRSWAALAVVFALVPLVGTFRYLLPYPSESRRLAVVQPGVDMAFGDPSTEEMRLRQAIPPLLDQAVLDRADLVIMPEGIAPTRRMPPRPPFPLPEGTPVLFGGQRGTGPSYQSTFFFDGGRWHYADKTRLVIFGEFVPFRDLLPRSFNLPSGDLAAGIEGVRGFRVGRDGVGPLLCFEALFPDLAYQQSALGADVLAVMSIDDWFVGTNAVDQLKAASVWRAIETGRPLARAASLGPSLIVGPRGAVAAETPVGVSAVRAAEVRVPRGAPLFPHWPVPILSLVALTYGLLWPFRYGSSRGRASADTAGDNPRPPTTPPAAPPA